MTQSKNGQRFRSSKTSHQVMVKPQTNDAWIEQGILVYLTVTFRSSTVSMETGSIHINLFSYENRISLFPK